MADALFNPLRKNLVWRHQFSKNFFSGTVDAGPFAVNSLKAQTLKKVINPWIGFQVTVLQHTGSPHGYANFPVRNHLNFNRRPVQFVVQNDMQGIIEW